MKDAARRAQLERQWHYLTIDQDIAHEIYHEDAILEFPQSGERFVGVANFREWRRRYPTPHTFTLRSIRGSGDLWVEEVAVSYDGAPSSLGVGIFEFRGDKVARETIYVADPWDAPEWRKPWRATDDTDAAIEG